MRPCSLILVAVVIGCAGDDTESADPSPNGLTPGAGLAIVSGEGQTGVEGLAVSRPLVVRLMKDGAPIAGATVEWTVTGGSGATVAPAAPATDATGIGTARLVLAGTGAYTVTASTPPSVAVTFHATAVANRRPVLVSETPIPPNYGIHDTYVRDGLAFVCAWNSGVSIYDVGNGIKGGSPAHPVLIGAPFVPSDNGVPGGPAVHNAWWFHNPVTGEKRYLFVGQEGPALLFSSASGDIHVLDVADLEHPREVGYFKLAGAGAHNFWMDEANQRLYAAYYNGGVVALDVSGELNGDLASRVRATVKPGGPTNTFVWGVQLAGGALWAVDMVSGFWKLDPTSLAPLGGGNNVPDRYSSDLWVSGTHAYTGTWGSATRNGTGTGNAIKVWNLAGAAPALVDSVIFANLGTVSDLEVSPDGKFLVATTERGGSGAGLYVLSLADPGHPTVVGYWMPAPNDGRGLHTGTLAAINGRSYVFAAKNTPNPALQVFDVTGSVP